MRILIADDDPFSRQLLNQGIQQLGHDVVECRDGSAALAMLTAADAPRLALLDWTMPNLDGLEVCRAVRQCPGPYTYTILVTERDARKELIRAFEDEVDDFLTRPIDPLQLRLRVRAGERVLASQERLLRAQDLLRYEATHDQLTGMWNRSAILERLESELNRARRGSRPIGIMVADLDHFKSVNDTYGHQAGDEVLRIAATRVRSVLRDCDTIGRYGGEEFLVITPDADFHGVLTAAERARIAVAAEPITAGEATLACHVSIGVACSQAGTERSDALVSLADAALYRAKSGGRNRVAT